MPRPPLRLASTSPAVSYTHLHQWYYRADDIEHKTKLLVNLLQQPEATRAIVFVRKRERVHELANGLREAGINTCWLEGEMVQDVYKRQVSPGRATTKNFGGIFYTQRHGMSLV